MLTVSDKTTWFGKLFQLLSALLAYDDTCPVRIHCYSIGLMVYRARRAVHALIFFLQQSIVQNLLLPLLCAIAFSDM